MTVKSGDEASATGEKKTNLMRSILPCLKTTSNTTSSYSAVTEQFLTVNTLYTDPRDS